MRALTCHLRSDLTDRVRNHPPNHHHTTTLFPTLPIPTRHPPNTGGIYRDGAICTDPVILSRSGRFGPTDLGPAGIFSFFARHRCNSYCRREWSMPRDQTPYLAAQSSTSMMDSAQKARMPGNRQFDMAPPPPRPLTYRPDLPPLSEQHHHQYDRYSDSEYSRSGSEYSDDSYY